MKEDNFENDFIEEVDEFNTDSMEFSLEDVEELSDEETESTEGGGVNALKGTTRGSFDVLSGTSSLSGTLKSYGKHCGGIELIVKTPSISVPKVGQRIGIIDKIYVTKSSIPARVSGVGTSNLVVTRSSGKIGLVTLEIHGHQQGEPKNWRFVVVRVNFL